MDWVTADLQPAFIGGVFWNFYRTPEEQRNWNVIRQGIARSAILSACWTAAWRAADLSLAMS